MPNKVPIAVVIPDNPSVQLGSVLVTGGCGFLGYHILSLLRSRYADATTQVSVLDLRLPKDEDRIPGINYLAGDLTNTNDVRQILNKTRPDAVIHTASPVAIQADAGKLKALFDKVNIQGTKLLLDESQKAGVKAFVYTSSASVISGAYDIINADETYPVLRGDKQPEYYSETKAIAEDAVIAANTRPTHTSPNSTTPSIPAFLTAAIRPSAIYGERDVQQFKNMTETALAGKTGFQIGDNTNLWDFTYAGNAAYAHILAAKRLLETWERLDEDKSPTTPEFEKETAVMDPEDEIKVDGEVFIITNDQPMTFWDWSRYVFTTYHRVAPKELGVPTPKSSGQVWVLNPAFMAVVAVVMTFVYKMLGLGYFMLSPFVVRLVTISRYFDIRKARQRLGYEPLWSIEESVESSCKWFAEKHMREKLEKAQDSKGKKNQ